MPKRIQVEGVPVDALGKSELLDRLDYVIAARLPTQVVTVNPEFVVRAQHDAAFRHVLRSAQLAIADGIGIRAAVTSLQWPLPRWQPFRFFVALSQSFWAGLLILIQARALRDPIPETVTGVDLIAALAERGAAAGWRFYLLGGEHGSAKRAADALRVRCPTLKILGAEEGLSRAASTNQTKRVALARRIGELWPDVLLVAFGAPKQDLFIAEQRKTLNIPVMIGVGGSFDFIAGAVKRAPVWLRQLGLEWLWRLAHQPWRASRIWNAVVVFPWLVFWSRQRP